jgi:hypothetical protein
MQCMSEQAAQAAVWIASYPKSGNTWVQTVIRHAGRSFGFPRGDLDVYKLMAEGREPEVVGGVRAEVSRGGRVTVLKTHARYSEAGVHPRLGLRTAGFVYVMRNPLDMLLSYINFTRMQYERQQNNADYQQALFIDLLGFERPLAYEEWRNVTLEDLPRERLDHALARFTEQEMAITANRMAGGSWLEHCRSWLDCARKLPSVVLRYEDLLRGPEEFMPLARLFTFSPAQIEAAVAEVNARQRGLQFKRVFFNKMSAHYYTQFFSASLISAFLQRFAVQLKEFGYGDLPQSA